MAKVTPNTNQEQQRVCDRIYSDGGAHSVSLKEGVPTCQSCGQPTKLHGTNQEQELREALINAAKPYVLIRQPSDEQQAQGGVFTISHGGEADTAVVLANLDGLVKFVQAHTAQQVAEAEQRGAARELDRLWENSYYRSTADTNKMIENRMIELFGENWSTTMYAILEGKS